ncbi:MAG: tRNA pseudouridine(54/55) synthase Pus10 [Thermoplasmata archaeon]
MSDVVVPPPPTHVTFPLTPEVLESARRAAGLGLCAECFGRLFGRLGHGLTNPERARRLFAALGRETPVHAEPCALCGGVFDRWDTWVPRVLRAGEGVEWKRFACGSRWDPERLAHEEAIWVSVGSAFGESARGAYNRELGKHVEVATGALGGPDRPDVVFLADLPVGRVEVTILPLYLCGRYRKLDRTLPQTRWPCRRCGGRGCVTCHGTGKTYPTSVEEIVAAPVLRATGGAGSRFHGMGREDIDARMLGRGRPFVLEVLKPRRRTIDLGAIAAELAAEAAGRVEVDGLALGDAAEVVRVKELAPTKSYRVVVLGEAPRAKVNEALAFVAGRAIAQRTPTRVAHRRSDRVRTRRILEARLVDADVGRFTLDLRAEAGTYIKEWVEGDGGRTESSLSQLLGIPLKVEALDVLEIHDTEA